MPKENNIFHGKDMVYSFMKIKVQRKIDTGMIMLKASQEDIKSLDTLLKQNKFDKPEIKISIYKNRRGRYKDILLWCKADLSTCRIEPIFATNYQYELVPIEETKINVSNSKDFVKKKPNALDF